MSRLGASWAHDGQRAIREVSYLPCMTLQVGDVGEGTNRRQELSNAILRKVFDQLVYIARQRAKRTVTL